MSVKCIVSSCKDDATFLTPHPYCPQHLQYIYPEIHTSADSNVPPVLPENCPCCGAKAVSKSDNEIKYACGGDYTSKPQIQNHTRKLWGFCPSFREVVRGIRGVPCEGCGAKIVDPLVSQGWTCPHCNHEHKAKR